MEMVFAQKCDVGLKREINQDSVLCCADPIYDMYLYVVADGMGGHTDGEKASGEITSALKRWWDDFGAADYHDDFRRILAELQNCIYDANVSIFQKYNQNTICGSTCIVLLIYKGNFAVFNAGDSHIYRKRGFKFEPLTIDDTWENQALIRDRYTKEQIERHPHFGKLVNAIGTGPEAKISVKSDVLADKDTFLLCSDGLYKYCSEKKIKKIMSKFSGKNSQNCVDELFEEVVKNGAGDNVSIILAKYYE